MRVIQFARNVKARLFDPKVKPHVPDFSEAALIAAVQAWRSRAGGAQCESGVAARDDAPDSLASVVSHFQQRRTPAFFADGTTLRALARSLPSVRPGWRERLLASVACDRTGGLPIYSIKGPPLRPGFPWGGLDAEPNKDDLYSSFAHRFAFAPRHALAILYEGGSGAELAGILEDWMRFAAMGTSSLPYCSTHVVIQRLLALSWARAFVTAAPVPDDPGILRLHSDILRILRADSAFLLPRLGRSAPNNHLLADRFAAWYIRWLYPEFVCGPTHIEAHEASWRGELERQIYRDGTSFEHSLHYHESVCEMAVAYLLLLRRSARTAPPETLRRTERMLEFQARLAGPGLVRMAFGDATEDPLFPLDPGDGWFTGGLRELYRALFNPALRPAAPTDPSIERAFWLSGGQLAPPPPDAGDHEARPHAWLDGGIGLFPTRSGDARVVFRTGPAPDLNVVAGHMHADLLSVYASYGGRPVLTDAGTWCYRFQARPSGPGRAYFCGPSAHNGPAINDVDPLGAVRGDFRNREAPVRVATRRCLLGKHLGWIEAEICGSPPYGGYRRGVVHVGDAYWIIYDIVPEDGIARNVTLGFQAAVGIAATRDPAGTVWLRAPDSAWWLTASPGLGDARIITGQHEPPGGWVSPGYGQLEPAPQVLYRMLGGQRVTAFTLGTGGPAARPVAIRVLDTGMCVDIEAPGARDRVLLAAPGAGIELRTGAIHGHAAAVWTRSCSGQAERVQCLDYRQSQPCPAAAPPILREAELPAARGADEPRDDATPGPTELSIDALDDLCIAWQETATPVPRSADSYAPTPLMDHGKGPAG